MNKRKKMEQRDNSIHFQLRNWAAYVNDGWVDGPRQHPKSADWQNQVTHRVTDIDEPEPHYIDIDAAKRIADSLRQCRKRDLETYWILAWFYRDGWDVGGLRRARNRFWKWL